MKVRHCWCRLCNVFILWWLLLRIIFLHHQHVILWSVLTSQWWAATPGSWPGKIMKNILLSCLTLSLFQAVGFSVKCYVGVEPEGERWTACDLDRGMRTCYTKYNWNGDLVARGCASKEKMFTEQCEVHEMDDISEKFCYCSFNWCNRSPHLTAVIFQHRILVLCLVLSINCYKSYCLQSSWRLLG